MPNKTSLVTVALLVALLAGAYQLHYKKVLEILGVIGRSKEAVGNTNCRSIPALEACESR